jgi:tetratricopeptide (TPR) repeat protein
VPIHFAVTVSQENRLFRGQPIEDNLEMKGMMYRLKREKGRNMVDLDATVDLYLNQFKYRGVADSSIYKDDNASRLTNNYAAGFLYAAEELRQRGDKANAMAMVKKSIEVVPGEWRSYIYLMQLYADMDSLEKVEELIRSAPTSVEANDVWLSIAGDFHRTGRKQQAYALLKRKLEEFPNESRFHRQLLNLYFRDSLYDSMEASLNDWVASNPSDTDAQAALREVRELKAEQSGVHLRGLDIPGGSK